MTITDETPETIDGAARVRRRGDDAAVLRLSEAEAAAIGTDATTPDDDERVLLNMGPSHPSTHGVLRLMLEMEGETVIRSKPVVGYLHTGMEKQAEQLTFLQGWHARLLDGAHMDEYVLAAVFGLNETKPLGRVEELDCSNSHHGLL